MSAKPTCEPLSSVTSPLRGARSTSEAAFSGYGTTASASPAIIRNGTSAVSKKAGVNMALGPAIDTAALIRSSRRSGWKAASVLVMPPRDSPITPMRSGSMAPENSCVGSSFQRSNWSIRNPTSPGW